MKYIKYLLIAGFVQLGFAQQDALFTNYMFNPANFNPAYTGSRGVTSLFLQHRQQWQGIAGAPETSYFNVQTYNAANKSGWGLGVQNDQLGNIKETEVSVDYAYHLKLSEKGQLSLGLKGSLNQYAVDFSVLNPYQQDGALVQNIDRNWTPNFGMGLFYYTDRSYVGIAIPHLLEQSHYDTASGSQAVDKAHFNASAGYVFDLSPRLQWKPSIFMRTLYALPAQWDLSSSVLIDQKVQFGLTYRIDAALAGMAAFQVHPQWLMGYSYDFDRSPLTNYNQGSHEIFLRYEFGSAKNRIVQSPRFF